MTSSNLLTVVVDRWARTLSPTEYKIVTYLYRTADASPDRKIGKSIDEIAEATDLAWRTVWDKLKDLDRDERRVIRILSHNKEKTLIEIPPEHWPLPVNNPEPVVEPQRPSTGSLAEQAMENQIIAAADQIPQPPASAGASR